MIYKNKRILSWKHKFDGDIDNDESINYDKMVQGCFILVVALLLTLCLHADEGGPVAFL